MKHDATAIALRTEKPHKTLRPTQFELLQSLGDITDTTSLDFKHDTPNLIVLHEIRFMLQGQIKHRQTSRCVAHRIFFNNFCTQHQAIQHKNALM